MVKSAHAAPTMCTTVVMCFAPVCAGVIVAVYVHVQQHRSLLMEEIVSKVMPYVHMPKAAPRATALDLNACPDMHIVTRILLQMLQVCQT